MVSNDNLLDCDTTCPQVLLAVLGHQFTLNLFHLLLYGADKVLEVQWLKNLSPVTTDYTTLHVDVLLHLDSASAQ